MDDTTPTCAAGARALFAPLALALAIAASPACGGAGTSDDSAGAGGSSSTTSSSGGSGGGTSLGLSSGGGTGPYSLPGGFTKTESGGYRLGSPFDGDQAPAGAGDGTTSSNGCGSILAVIRDFKGSDESGGHPDFEHYLGQQPTTGLVKSDLGTDFKPVYTGACESKARTSQCPYGAMTTNGALFDQWYRGVADVNKQYILNLSFEPNGNVSTFRSDLFFPLDGQGWGNSGKGEDGQQHNFGFTTEVHTEFQYNGGEQFTFVGDDDVWVFINNKLAVDLGGVHPAATGSVALDTLGLTKGTRYPLDLFHAERHTNASHFRVDTNLTFTNCGKIE